MNNSPSYNARQAHRCAEAPYIELIAYSPGPLPDGCYLAFHAACSKVLEESEAREIREYYVDEMENATVLEGDGSPVGFFQQTLGAATATFH